MVRIDTLDLVYHRYMDNLVLGVLLGLLGLCLGSFAGATVWRLRARQLVEDKADGEKVDRGEYKSLLPLTKSTMTTDRSQCLHCGHTLAWYDLLPLISWVSTGGKCRYCHKPIGWFEPLIELGTALVFITSFLFWPLPLQTTLQAAQFTLWLVAVVMLVILFAYDLKWFLLPDKIMMPLIAIAGLIALTHIAMAGTATGMALVSLIAGVAILSGLYLVLWLLSKGTWIGFGDVKLGLALALILGDWGLAFLTLFAANFIGLMIVLPGLLLGKIARTAQIPFGPLLIAGGAVVMLFGGQIVQVYVSGLGLTNLFGA